MDCRKLTRANKVGSVSQSISNFQRGMKTLMDEKKLMVKICKMLAKSAFRIDLIQKPYLKSIFMIFNYLYTDERLYYCSKIKPLQS